MSALAQGALQQAGKDAERAGKLLGQVYDDQVAIRSALVQLLQETITTRGELRAIRIMLEEADERRIASLGSGHTNP